MRTHNVETDRYQSTQNIRHDKRDGWIAAAILAAVVVLFAGYMWHTAAHYSDQYTPASETGNAANDNVPASTVPADNGTTSNMNSTTSQNTTTVIQSTPPSDMETNAGTSPQNSVNTATPNAGNASPNITNNQ